MRGTRRAFWLGLLVSLLLLHALRVLLSTTFYASLITLRLNATSLWTIVLLAPLAAPLLGRRASLTAIAVAGLACAALAWTRFTPTYLPLAATGTAAALLALAASARLPGAVPGALVGLALDAALLVAGGSHHPGLSAAGGFALLAAGGSALALAWSLEVPPAPRGGLLAGVALGAFFAVEVAFLLSPYGLARETRLPLWYALLASAGALGLGAMLSPRIPRPLVLAGALALVDVALLRSPLLVLTVPLAQLALGATAARLAPGLAGRWGAPVFAIVFASLAFVLLFFSASWGEHEWPAIVPALGLVTVAGAWTAPRAMQAPWRLGAAPAGALLLAVALSAWPAALPEPAPRDEITLVSFNVHQGFGNGGAIHPEVHSDALRALDADVIVLQETDTARLSSGGLDIARYLARDLGYHAAYGQSGVAILSRYPFTDDPRPPEHIWTLEAPIDVGGTTVWVHGVHLARGRQADARADQVAALLADDKPTPHILAGDFNSCPTRACAANPSSDRVYDRLTARYQDAWVAIGNDRDATDGNTHPAWGPVRRIDLVLVEGLEVLDARPVLDERTRAASDHLPVLVRVRLP